MSAPAESAPGKGVVEGACLCGAVRVTLPDPVATTDACHCGICRKLCGGGPMLALHAPRGAKPAVEGEDNLSVYASSEWAERAFCRTCGTPVWYRFVEADFHSLSAGLFDTERLTLTREIFIEAKPALYDLAGERPRLTEAEVIAAFEKEAGA
ncbi:MAG: GFA family protein [Pseudomonadota bacterium]